MSNLSDYKKAAQELANTQHNQASEDELRKELDRIYDWYELIGEQYSTNPADTKTYDDLSSKIIDVIRTEKLKLLAEVRERVVGEDADVDAAYKIGFDNGQDATAHNELRADQRAALDKLEAEL